MDRIRSCAAKKSGPEIKSLGHPRAMVRLDTSHGEISMTESLRFTFAEPGSSEITARVVERFITAFQRKDPSAIPDLVATDCVMEAMQPAPNGQRVEGYEANVAFWQAMVADSGGTFEVEDVVICGDRATNRWRYRFGDDEESSVRGVTLFVVRDGKIAEALGYAKTMPRTALGQDGTAGP
jgi:ketosteroid isomerase-like protein